MKQKKAAIVGAGIGGLAAAIRLASRGYAVSLYEQNAYAGGKLSELALGSFRFDKGPSLLTMPYLIDELFLLSGAAPADYFTYESLEEACRYFFPSGKQVRAWSDAEALAQELASNLGERPEAVRRYLKRSEKSFSTAGELFLKRPMERLQTWTNFTALKTYPQVFRLGLLSTLHGFNRRYFRSPEARQLFDRYATYNGSDPYQTPGLMHLIPHLEYNEKPAFPRGGMYRIVQALQQRAEEMGVAFHFNCPVREIRVEKGRATGLETEQGSHQADVVLCNGDMARSYQRLLPSELRPAQLMRQEKSSSCIVFYWGMDRLYPQLGLHNILFSDDYRQEFRQIFQEKRIPTDPTVYLNITSKHAPADAPKGCENWFVMVNTGHNTGQDWEALRQELRPRVIEKVEKLLGEPVAPHIVAEDYLDPLRIEWQTSSAQGALYGNASNKRLAAFFRHPARAPKVQGLYFCGGSVHPGGGIPLALLSAQLAEGAVAADAG